MLDIKKSEKWDTVKMFLNDAIENPDKYTDKATVLVWSPEEVSKIFTKERMKILETIKTRKPKTVTSLANALKRKVSAVDRDLKVLELYNIVELKRHGRESEPELKTEVLILPIVKIEPYKLKSMPKAIAKPV